MRAENVKRVVITSTTGAVTRLGLDKPIFDESDWNQESVLEIESQGKAAHPRDSYGASKTLAERAAWAFMERHQPGLNFDLVVLNPPWVFGPTLTPEKMGLSLGHWRDGVLGIDVNPETNAAVPEQVSSHLKPNVSR